MKSLAWVAVAVAAVVCVVSGDVTYETAALAKAAAEKAPAPPAKKTDGPPPLVLDDEPLLLLDKPAGKSAAAANLAGNPRCYVCHLNYSDEELTVSHAMAKIGCNKCHGESDAHCGDEGNVTAPSIFYTKADVDPSCRTCHDPEKVVDGALYCMAEIAPEDAKKTCTECHGKHRMAVRNVRWNPKTREPYAVKAPEAKGPAQEKRGERTSPAALPEETSSAPVSRAAR